jgi:hypothetical protein
VAFNPHAVIDWAIATGRAPLDSRSRLLDQFAADPVHTLGALLSQEPTRTDRPCPLLATDPRRTSTSTKSGVTRRRNGLSQRRVTDSAVRAAFAKLGVDHETPEARKAISDAVGLAQAEARKHATDEAIRQRRRATALETEMGTAALRVLDFWAPTPEEQAELEAQVARELKVSR